MKRIVIALGIKPEIDQSMETINRNRLIEENHKEKYWRSVKNAAQNGLLYQPRPQQWSSNDEANLYLTHVNKGEYDGIHYHPDDLMFDHLPSLSGSYSRS